MAGKYQVYNSRAGRYIVFENGKIKKQSKNKVKGVPVKAAGSGSGRKKRKKKSIQSGKKTPKRSAKKPFSRSRKWSLKWW